MRPSPSGLIFRSSWSRSVSVTERWLCSWLLAIEPRQQHVTSVCPLLGSVNCGTSGSEPGYAFKAIHVNWRRHSSQWPLGRFTCALHVLARELIVTRQEVAFLLQGWHHHRVDSHFIARI